MTMTRGLAGACPVLVATSGSSSSRIGCKNGTFLNGARIEHALAKLAIDPGAPCRAHLESFDLVEEQVVQRQRLETVGRWAPVSREI